MTSDAEERVTMLMALHVTDEQVYARYRQGMTPILAEYGGAFRYDFRVAETLRSEAPHPITRVFCLAFPNPAAREAFFGDPRYLAVRQAFFGPSVAAATAIGVVT